MDVANSITAAFAEVHVCARLATIAAKSSKIGMLAMALA